MLRLLSTLILTFLLSAPVYAADWDQGYNGDGTIKACKTLSHGTPMCAFNPTVSEASSILAVHQCENFDVIFNSDLLAATHDTVVDIYSCANPTADANNCEIIEATTLDGDPAVAGFYILGAAAIWIYADVTVTAADTPRVLVNCHAVDH